MSAGGMNQYLSPIVNIDYVADAFQPVHFTFQTSAGGGSFGVHVGSSGSTRVHPLYTTRVRIHSISLDKEVGLIKINVLGDGMTACAGDNLGRLDGRLKFAMMRTPYRDSKFSPRVWAAQRGLMWTIKCYPARCQLYTGVGRDLVKYDPQTADEHLGAYFTKGRYINVCFSVQKPFILEGPAQHDVLIGNRLQVEALHFTNECDERLSAAEQMSLQNVWDNNNNTSVPEESHAAADECD